MRDSDIFIFSTAEKAWSLKNFGRSNFAKFGVFCGAEMVLKRKKLIGAHFTGLPNDVKVKIGIFDCKCLHCPCSFLYQP